MKTRVVITRTDHTISQTLGFGEVIIFGKCVFRFFTLELPWLDNNQQISCIPQGTYKAVQRTSAAYGIHWHILNVPDRSLILIHHGNFHKDTKGCILVGSGFRDIDNDGVVDVINSKATMGKLRKLLPIEFELIIR